MTQKNNPFLGKWRITWMEAWDEDFFDMEVPAFILVKRDNLGEFHFGNVQGEIDGRITNSHESPRMDFTWAGNAEMDEAYGRGWIMREGGELTGCIYFHMGEESAFRANHER